MIRQPTTSIFVLLITALAASGCGKKEAVTAPPGDEFQPLITQFKLAAQSIPFPDNNDFNAERVALGQLLFFDPILGGESAPWIKIAAGKDPYRYRANDVACATCHHPAFAFADGRRLGAGVGGGQLGDLDLGPQRVVPGHSLISGRPIGMEPRNTPTVLNAACNGQNSPDARADGFQFMDGRAKGLEAQAILPITSREEMAGDAYGIDVNGDATTKPTSQDSVAGRVRGIPEYVSRFKQAFPGEITQASDITIQHIGRAIAAFERELITPGSRYDQFIAGNRSVLNDVEKSGFKLFFGKANCASCHNGPMLSDFTFRVQGVGDAYAPGFAGKNGHGGDFGRFHADTVQFASQKYAFRVPTIRNVELTAPYFHSGSAGTLRGVVEFYNRGGLGAQDLSGQTLLQAGATRDPAIRPLGLTSEEMDQLVAFMRTTTAQVQMGSLGSDLTAVPQRVPSGLLPPGVPTPPGPGPFLPDRTSHRIVGLAATGPPVVGASRNGQ